MRNRTKFRILVFLITVFPFFRKPIVADNESLPKKMGLGMVRFYQTVVSSQWGAHCNFYPSCSAFGYQAIKRYGLFWGTLMISDRVQRCHPGAWGRYPIKHGRCYDPVENHYFGHRYYKQKNNSTEMLVKEIKETAPGEVRPTDIGFANKLMEDGDYALAAIEFKRCLSNPTEEAALALYDIGLCYYKLNDFSSAINYWSEFIKTYPEYQKVDLVRYSMACAYFLKRDYTKALQQYKKLASRDNIYHNKAFFMAGISLLKEGKMKKAQQTFAELVENSDQKSQLTQNARKIVNCLNEFLTMKKKNPLLVAILSGFLPGIGQIYCKRFWDGIFTMGLNTAIGCATWYAFHDKSLTREVIFVPLFSFFYSGNVYGAFGAARNYESDRLFLKLREMEKFIPYNILLID